VQGNNVLVSSRLGSSSDQGLGSATYCNAKDLRLSGQPCRVCVIHSHPSEQEVPALPREPQAALCSEVCLRWATRSCGAAVPLLCHYMVMLTASKAGAGSKKNEMDGMCLVIATRLHRLCAQVMLTCMAWISSWG